MSLVSFVYCMFPLLPCTRRDLHIDVHSDFETDPCRLESFNRGGAGDPPWERRRLSESESCQRERRAPEQSTAAGRGGTHPPPHSRSSSTQDITKTSGRMEIIILEDSIRFLGLAHGHTHGEAAALEVLETPLSHGGSPAPPPVKRFQPLFEEERLSSATLN